MKFQSLFTCLLLFLSLTVLAQPAADRIPTASGSEEIVFIDNFESINSFDELIKPYAGKVIYVDLWATWCGPCRREFQYKKQLHDYAEGKDIVFLYVSLDSKANNWRQFVEQNKITGHHALANDQLRGDLVGQFYRKINKGRKTLSLPTFIIVDKTGKVASKRAPRPSSGKRLYSQLDRQLKS
ncbi:MAG: TlpA disulfide reductase family protein [Bacteroidota bacterium]